MTVESSVLRHRTAEHYIHMQRVVLLMDREGHGLPEILEKLVLSSKLLVQSKVESRSSGQAYT